MAKKNRKLVQISAFWKNDKPGGIGVTIPYEAGDLDGIMKELTQSYDEMHMEAVRDGSVDELVRDLRKQLEQLAARKGTLDVKAVLMAIGNIYLLQKLKRIPSDEFNGLMLGYSYHRQTLH